LRNAFMGICKEKKVVHKAVRERKYVFFLFVLERDSQRATGLFPTHLKLKRKNFRPSISKSSGAWNTLEKFPSLELLESAFEKGPITSRQKSRHPGDGANLDLDGVLNSLALLLLAGVGLGTHDTTTPVAAGLIVLVGVALLDGGEELGELSLVLSTGLGESQDSGGLKTVELACAHRQNLRALV
jgi:hypothetical protein